MVQYIQVTEQFTTDNNNYYIEPNVLFIVKTLAKRYVTSINSYDEFTSLFEQNYYFCRSIKMKLNQFLKISPAHFLAYGQSPTP